MAANDPIDALIASAKDALAARDMPGARRDYAEAARLARSATDDGRLAYILRHLSDITRALDPAAALVQAQEAQRLCRSAAANLDLANATRLVALANAALSQDACALAAWREAGVLYSQIGVKEGADECERRIRALTP